MKQNNLEEMDTFLESQNLSKLNQDDLKYPNRPITTEKIELAIKRWIY